MRLILIRICIVIAVLLMALVLCSCPLSPFSMIWDQLAYPVWVDIVAPHPTSIDLPDPTLLQRGLPRSTNSIIWSNNGEAIAVMGGDREAPFIRVFDSIDGNMLQSQYSIDDNGFVIIHSSGLKFPEIDQWEINIATCSNQLLSATAQMLPENTWEITIRQSNSNIDSYHVYSEQWPITDRHLPYVGDLKFSPDCKQLAFTLSGWVYYEGYGREELWLLDVQAKTLHRVLRGRWSIIRLWDYPVQSVAPGWSPDSTAIVFGDPQFGLEKYSVESGIRTWLATPKKSGYRPIWSPSGEWIAAYREWNTDTSVVVLSSDGSHFDSAGGCYFPFDIAWSPADDSLAFLCQNDEESETELWIWPISEWR